MTSWESLEVSTSRKNKQLKSEFYNIMGTFENLGLMETDPKGWLKSQFSRVQVVSLRMVIFGKLQDRGAFLSLPMTSGE